MTLKQKMVLSLIVSGGILILFFYTAFHVTLRPSLEDQKLIFIETLKKKIRIALSIEKKDIAIHSYNWASWEGMAHYVKNPSLEFETELFPDMIFYEEIMDVVMVVKVAHEPSKEEILFFKGYKDRKFLNFNQMRINVEIQKIKDSIKRRPAVISTLLNSGVGPLLVVANPITNGKGLKKVAGVLILGRFIDKKMLGKISRYTLEEINTISFDPKVVEDFYSRQMKGNDLIYRENSDNLDIFYLLKDFHQRPAMILYTQVNNQLFRVVNQHFLTFVVITALSIIFLGLLLYYIIQKHIIIRMQNISDTMDKIESWEDLSKRINLDKKYDEISHLISSINLMLDKLENEKVKRENAERTMITQGKLVSIGRLASCISHEINNPLLAIGNSLQVIKKISRSKSSLFKDALEICESEIERISDIISSLLDFHRLEQDEFTPLEVKEIILKSLDVLKWSKNLGSVKIIQKMENHCFVYGSSAKLKQVFINFILNATEAMESAKQSNESQYGTSETDGTLRIEVKNNKRKNVVETHFIDNGPGIPEEVKSHLFEPFVSTKEAKGVGLGLYVSYKIIGNHKGEIIYNNNYKKGTHFIIKLPAIKRLGNG
ncbi:MAG: ATP-binding protein [Candidatus Aminicenantes bacterium]